MKTIHTFTLSLALCLLTSQVAAAELVQTVRSKLSAGDLASGVHAVEEYKKKNGVDNEYLDAVGWLARGAEMLGRREAAAAYVAELRREIREEKSDWLGALGAAIEVEGKLIAARDGRGPALQFLTTELGRAKSVALRSRIGKNINQLSLEGQPAPPLAISDFIGPQPQALTVYKGKPVLLFMWANWCGDCRAQAAALAGVWKKYRAQGLVVIAPTRYYGNAGPKTATPAAEKVHVEKIWKEGYAGLEEVPIVIDTETMVRYGVSATPTFVLIDRRGLVRMYAVTRMAETELSRQIEAVLAEAP
ncbi:MAG: TlpA family protein disulfide reductase [Blastocatellia bacterium]